MYTTHVHTLSISRGGVSLSPDGRTGADRAYLHSLRGVSRLVQDMESALKEFDVWLGLLQCLVFLLVLVLDGPVYSGDEQAFLGKQIPHPKREGQVFDSRVRPRCLN